MRNSCDHEEQLNRYKLNSVYELIQQTDMYVNENVFYKTEPLCILREPMLPDGHVVRVSMTIPSTVKRESQWLWPQVQ